jgi:hypothetical protein
VKLIAHRGWSQGGDENTLAAFVRAAADHRVSGVEFDVGRAASGTLVVSHDTPRGDAPVLTLEAALALLAGTDLDLFVEIKQAGIAAAVIDRLVAAGVADRSVVFGFAKLARSFPWEEPRPLRLGAILLYPWTMHRFIDAHHPDVILLGWDQRLWTRAAVRAWWSVFSLPRLSERYAAPIAVGIVRKPADLRWLSARRVAAAIADIDFLADTPGVAMPRD